MLTFIEFILIFCMNITIGIGVLQGYLRDHRITRIEDHLGIPISKKDDE